MLAPSEKNKYLEEHAGGVLDRCGLASSAQPASTLAPQFPLVMLEDREIVLKRLKYFFGVVRWGAAALKAFNEPPLSLDDFARLDYISRATTWRVASSREFSRARYRESTSKTVEPNDIRARNVFADEKRWPRSSCAA